MPEIAQIFLLGFKSLAQDEQKEVVTLLCKDLSVNSMILQQLLSPPNEEPANKYPIHGSTSTRTYSNKLTYDSPGRLSGRIHSHQVSVLQVPRRRFNTMIDGIEYTRLTMDLVEGDLDIKVNRKQDGGNSETLARAIYRHFVDRYNGGDESVSYEQPNSQLG